MNELLKDFEVVKAVSGSGKKTPIVKLTTVEGSYLKGVLLSKRTYKDQDGKEKLIANFKASECTAPLIIKSAAGYQPHTFVPGEEVSVFGPPASLERSLNAIEADGTQEVLAIYEGKKKVKLSNGKSVAMHTFKVGKKTVAAQVKSEEIPD